MIRAYREKPKLQGKLSHSGPSIPHFGRFLFFCFVLSLSAAAKVRGPQARGHTGKGGMPGDPIPSRAEVSRAIALSVDYLERACGPDGKFVYEVDINSGQQSSEYNIVRHAGAMYALAMLNHSRPDRNAVNAMVRAATFLSENYIGPGVQPGQLVIWSEPLGRSSEAELGATGLGLVALAEVRKVAPKSVPLEQLQSLGRFVLFLQKEDGSFVSKYRPESGPEDWESLYYPGEAALGLIALYETDHSRDWLISAGKGLSYLATSRGKLTTVPADHWALIAISKLLPYCERDECPGASRMELLQYVAAVSNSIVHDQLRNPSSPLDGAFDPAGQTSAARLEGLLAALEFLPKGELRRRVEAAARRSTAFLLRAQIGSGRFAGGMPGALRTSALNSSQIRIDSVQHALCAWLRYLYLVRHE